MTQAQDTGLPRATEGTFIPDMAVAGRVHIQVVGENFVARAAPLRARVGEQIVSRLVLQADGRGFAGILERTPRDGDRLYVGYADAELQSTDVVYRGADRPGPSIA